MLKNSIRAVALMGLFGLAGCASPSNVGNMSVDDSRFVKNNKNSIFYKNISVGKVTGGSPTNPLFTSQVSSTSLRSALENSLSSAQFASSSTPGKYILNAHLTKLKQPMFGFNMTVHSAIQYAISDSETGKAVLNKTVEASSTKTMSDNFIGTQRIQAANEGAIKSNIGKLLGALSEVKSKK